MTHALYISINGVGLTYAALVGTDKQNVRDAECLLSSKVAEFMRDKYPETS